VLLLLLLLLLLQSPPPALINADLFCRAPDNVLLLLGLLRPEPEGVDDFYARYGAMQAMSALLAACPDKLQVSDQLPAPCKLQVPCSGAGHVCAAGSMPG
jgi:hypothetical protein